MQLKMRYVEARDLGLLIIASFTACSTGPEASVASRVLGTAQAWCGDTIQVTSEAYRGVLPSLMAGNTVLPVSRVNETTVQATLPPTPCGPLEVREVGSQNTFVIDTVETFGFVESFELGPGISWWGATSLEIPGRALVTGPTLDGAVVYDLTSRTATALPGLSGNQFTAAGLSFEPGRVFWLDTAGVPTAWDYGQAPLIRAPAHDPPISVPAGGSIHELSPGLWMRVATHQVRVNNTTTGPDGGKDGIWSPDRTLMVLRNGWNSISGFPVFDAQTGGISYHVPSIARPNGVAFNTVGDRMFVAGTRDPTFGVPGLVTIIEARSGTVLAADTLAQSAATAIAVDRVTELLYVMIADNPPAPDGHSVGVYSFEGRRIATLGMPDCPAQACSIGGTFFVTDQEMFFVARGGQNSQIFRFTLLPNRQ